MKISSPQLSHGQVTTFEGREKSKSKVYMWFSPPVVQERKIVSIGQWDVCSVATVMTDIFKNNKIINLLRKFAKIM